MVRPPRPIADGLLYHALNRGNNRTAVFHSTEDYSAFLQALLQTQKRYPFRLYGYCLMPNHFHLLLSPEPGQIISRILQSLTVAHTWRYHQQQGCSGHVWQGRFKSPVIQEDDHALVVLRYIESNPLRAGMVADMAGYPWSSYGWHGLGKPDVLLSPLAVWESLRRDEARRQAYWRTWVHTPLTGQELGRVRQSVMSGRPYGTETWTKHMAAALGLALESRPRGRPKKQREK